MSDLHHLKSAARRHSTPGSIVLLMLAAYFSGSVWSTMRATCRRSATCCPPAVSLSLRT